MKEIADPPALLLCRRTLLASDEQSVAIVGTRNPTTYGREGTAILTRGLVEAGLWVVCGLGLGLVRVA